jgi:hypothetical protein
MLGKTGKKINIDEAVVAQVNQDLIVHNMPNRTRAEMAPAAKSVAGSQFLSSTGKKNNFKMVGGLIVGLGIIFIGTLIYLSYYFIIKPRVNPGAPIASVVESTSSKIQKEDDSNINKTPTTTVVVETNPSVVDVEIGTTTPLTSSSTESAYGEEVMDLPLLVDTDSDGLNDEEELIFGTMMSSSDTDNDGYLDLAELKNGYSPLATNKSLYPNSLMTKYNNKVGKYELYYPASWGLKTLNNEYTTTISAPDDSLIQISVSDNPKIKSIVAWYEETFPGEIVTNDRLRNLDGWEGVMGADGLNFYLTGKDRENIYIVSYISANSERLVYPNVFQILINSFKLN